MINCPSVQFSSIDASCRRGSKASLARRGVMIIEKGQATMAASDSMASLAMIESPEGTTRKGTMSEAIRGKLVRGSTCLMCSAR